MSRITWPSQIEQWNHSSWIRHYNLNTPEGQAAWDRGEEGCIWLTHFDVLNSKAITRNGVTKRYPGHAERFLCRRHTPADMLVVDELSMFKDPSSVRAKHLHKYSHHFTRRIGLTGTPVPNDYTDLWGQIRAIDDGQRLGKSFFQYRQTYFTSDYMGYSWRLKPGAKEAIDAKLSDLALVMLGDDYLDVPTPSFTDVEITLPPEARKHYTRMEKELLLSMEEADVSAVSAAVLANKLRQITGGSVYGLDDTETRTAVHLHDAKLDALKKLLDTINEPVLVLCEYQHASERILRAIPHASVFNEKDIPKWQAGKIPVWLANPASMSHGIDGLQHGGRIAVWYDLTWSNERYTQTNARIIRTGQSQRTLVYRLVVRDSIDEAVVEALRCKSDEQSGLMTALKNLQMLRKKG